MISRRVQYELAGRVVGPALMALDGLRRRARRGKKRGESPFGPPLESGRKLKDLMSVQYLQGRYADGAVPVAWVTSGFPVEVLRALGFFVVYPENHGALCGARRKVQELSGVAEAEGFSQDLCSYARTDIGSMLSGNTPVGRLPRPDLLACCTNICQSVLYWYRVLAEHFKVPLVLIDTPYVYGDAKPHHLAYVKDQLNELVQAAERVGGKRMSSGELVEVMQLSREGTGLWRECLATGTHRPSPWTGFDGFIHMAPIVAMRGTRECNAYYRMLKDELDDRVARGIGGVRNERVRLLWDNLPVWYKIRELATTFAEAGFNFVCTTYTNAWAETVDLIRPEDPLGSGAEAYTLVLLNRDLPNRLKVMKGLAAAYGCQGAVLHSDRSCKPYSIGQLDLKSRLAAEANLKVLLIEADHADPRGFSEEQVQNRVQAFIESFRVSGAAAIGVDVGSTTWKAVAIDEAGAVVGSLVEPTHPRIEEQTARALEKLRAQCGASAALPVGATGYGRKLVKATRALTEITCHARGAFALMGRPGVLIDIGGQDSKVIRIGEGGEVQDFAMNDKCAAGTGRFLEVILGRLQVPYADVAAAVARAARPVPVSSTCTVFAESEVVSLVARGEPLEGILRGLHQSLATRVAALAGKVPDGRPLFMSGGVALNQAMVHSLGEALGRRLEVVPSPQLVGALGAAIAVMT